MKETFTVLIILFTGAKIIAQSNPQSVHHIGEHFGGGIIFFVDETGQHGLIAAPSDQSDRVRWGCSHNKIKANSLNDGSVNTKLIVEHCGKKTAAGICTKLNIDGFNDWYLPSLEELNLIYQNRMRINGLTMNDYCSSTEYGKGGNDIYAIHFGSNGKTFRYNKSHHYRIRAVRKF